MSFRKEKKFRVSRSEACELRALLLSRGMEVLYRPRKIHSLYFDSLNFNMFTDSEEGVLPRRKVRVRWYNNSSEFTFETKISSIEGRFKSSRTLPTITSDLQLRRKKFVDTQYGPLFPSLQVNYLRYYFRYKSMRITFDEGINYSDAKDDFRFCYYDPEQVVEVKTPPTCHDDFIACYLPQSSARFSKYSRGRLLSLGEMSEY